MTIVLRRQKSKRSDRLTTIKFGTARSLFYANSHIQDKYHLHGIISNLMPSVNAFIQDYFQSLWADVGLKVANFFPNLA